MSFTSLSTQVRGFSDTCIHRLRIVYILALMAGLVFVGYTKAESSFESSDRSEAGEAVYAGRHRIMLPPETRAIALIDCNRDLTRIIFNSDFPSMRHWDCLGYFARDEGITLILKNRDTSRGGYSSLPWRFRLVSLPAGQQRAQLIGDANVPGEGSVHDTVVAVQSDQGNFEVLAITANSQRANTEFSSYYRYAFQKIFS